MRERESERVRACGGGGGGALSLSLSLSLWLSLSQYDKTIVKKNRRRNVRIERNDAFGRYRVI